MSYNSDDIVPMEVDGDEDESDEWVKMKKENKTDLETSKESKKNGKIIY